MFACICAAVDEREILAAVDDGADTVSAVGSRLAPVPAAAPATTASRT